MLRYGRAMTHDTAHTEALELCTSLPIISTDQQPVYDDLLSWANAITGDADTAISPDALASMLVHSLHLQTLARRHQDAIVPILLGQGATIVNTACDELTTVTPTIRDDSAMMRALRRLRQRSALAVALSDLCTGAGISKSKGTSPDIGKEMEWLSSAAETAVRATVRYLFDQAARRGKCPPQAETMEQCGWVILALGKLGAAELNYSSDIDLIILHDPDSTPLFATDTAQQFYVEQTRALVRLLSQITVDGIGWRVDLRLRPDPGATAVSIQIAAALSYYESIARTWERAAFIRARPIAGDLTLGASFLSAIQPFIWRRTLDYTVIEDMKSMLSRPLQPSGWHGYNLKTGKNGIRQIEFFTHVLQLVTGGRILATRQSQTLPALQALADEEWISQEQARNLAVLYHAIRRVEHRLQMLSDAQTHSLPRSETALLQFAQFLGHESSDTFLAAMANVMQAIGANTTHKLIEDAQQTAINIEADEDNLLIDDTEQLMEWLAAHGFQRPGDVCATLDGWMAGRIATTRGERARSLLNGLMPTILGHLAGGSSPDDQFAAFAQFTEALPASVQIFSLLDHNRQLTKLLCDMLVLSPRMTSYLRRNPALFDLVLFDDFFDPLPDAAILAEQMQAAIADLSVEEALDAIKRRAREWRFQCEVQALSHILHPADLGQALSMIADVVVRAVHQLAIQDMQRRHGSIDGQSAILALGRLGTGALTAHSDLDLVVVFQAGTNAQSNGDRALGATAYFARLTQTFVNWLSRPTAEGSLYEVDMRLRPDGDNGAVAVGLGRFTEYYIKDAWVWEKLALAKARIITDPAQAPALVTVLTEAICETTQHPIDLPIVSNAVFDMRRRLREAYGSAPALQLRRLPGGTAELDLLLQGLRFVNADLFTGTGQSQIDIISKLASAKRISQTHAADLEGASQLFNDVYASLRLCVGAVGQNAGDFSTAVVQFIVENNDAADEAQLIAMLDGEREKIMAVFDAIYPPQHTFNGPSTNQ
jgi:glutamate-ammonia-ligase adenylyltransferase